MVEMIEKYKEEEPDNEFAELDVTERIETKFIVRKTKFKDAALQANKNCAVLVL